MSSLLILIPAISALLGWVFNKLLAGYILNNYLPQQQNAFAAFIAARAAGLLPFAKMEEKIADPALIEKAMPSIEAHIDEFLHVKLPQEIPMLGMFIGDKTTGKVKEVFITQLKELFPKVMNDITGGLKESLDIQTLVSTELSKPGIQAAAKHALSPQINRFAGTGLLLGLLIGIINILLFVLFK